MECECCKYYDSEDCRCTWLACDGLDCDEKLPCEIKYEEK